ncbi:hypothetical protein [Nonomuraea sp. NPDC002799]
MLTEFLRDQCFTTAWFGLMSFVWFGWSQEDPPRRWRIWLGAGSVLGVGIAVAFGVLTAANWDQPSALAGKYAWFGVLAALGAVAPRLRGTTTPGSRVAGPIMGATLLLSAAIGAVIAAPGL